MREIEVSLDERTAAFLGRVTAQDRFPDAREVIRHGLALMTENDRHEEEVWAGTVRTYGIEGIRALIDEGLASGEPIEVTDDLFENVKRRGREQLAPARAAE